MKSVRIPDFLLDQIRDHSREAYPEECCGFLLAPALERSPSEVRQVDAIERARNDFDGARRRRFAIRPEDLRDLERRMDLAGRAVVGFYHSHPDHPANPSEYDRDHAWPWYSYLIASVTATATGTIAAFELDAETSVFHEVPLLTSGATERGVRVAHG